MDRPRQLPLPLSKQDGARAEEGQRNVARPAGAPRLTLIRGEGKKKPQKLGSRDDLARVLVGAAGDMLLHRISAPRAHEIEQRVERLLALFDRVDLEPLMEPILRRELDELELLLRESAAAPRRR